MKSFKLVVLWILSVLFSGLLGVFVIGLRTEPEVSDLQKLFTWRKHVSRTRKVPLPHQVPPSDDVLSLRFAMVHDVLTERYRRHSDAWYRKRNENVRKKIEKLNQKNVTDQDVRTKLFNLYDDLGVGLERLGKHDKALEVLREKKAKQDKAGVQENRMYTTYANLGTVLAHKHLPAALRGNRQAKSSVRQALDHLNKAVDINPSAHFGRETWQITALAFLLAATENNRLIKQFDFTGNRLAAEPNPETGSAVDDIVMYKRFTDKYTTEELRNPQNEVARSLRDFVAKLEKEDLMKKVNLTDDLRNTPFTEEVPFDRPVLGIIGMWRLGGGPNPHFALALGEIMLRVGQRHIAWEAYQRALEMSGRFWPEEAVRKPLIEHCRARKKLIESSMSDRDVQKMKRRFRQELQHGRDWQNAYRAFEKKRIRQGVSINRDNFHKPFLEKHGKIASDPGDADWIRFKVTDDVIIPWVGILFFAGLGGLFVGLLLYVGKPNHTADDSSSA